MNEKLIDLQISGVKEAAGRSRIAFFILVFACGAILIALYDDYFNWNRIYGSPNRGLDRWPAPAQIYKKIKEFPVPIGLSGAEEAQWRRDYEIQKTERKEDRKNNIRENEGQEERNVVDGEIIGIDLLGIKLGAADLDIFGSAGLSFLSLYYLLCVLRTSVETVALCVNRSTHRVHLEVVDFIRNFKRTIHTGSLSPRCAEMGNQK